MNEPVNEYPVIKRVLAATDFDDCATGALEHAKKLSRRFAAEIMMMHAVPIFASVEPIPLSSVPFAAGGDSQESAAYRAVDEYRRLHLGEFPAATAILEAGDPATAILATSRSRSADLVVMGTHGRKGFDRMLLGSVAERVIRESDRPVLTIRCKKDRREPGYTRILCPVNYTATAARAFRYGQLLASAFEAEHIALRLIENDFDHAGDELDRLREWIGDVAMATRANLLVQRGEAAAQVIRYAEEHQVDLIVLGARQKSGGNRSVLGSTTDKLTRYASCPVLTVPGPADRY